MTNKTKEFILKALLVLGLSLFAGIFPGCFIWVNFVKSEEIGMIICYTLLFSCFGVGALFIVLSLIFGTVEEKPVKAEKMSISFGSYSEFSDFLQKRLPEKEYKLQKPIPLSFGGEVVLFLKPEKLWTLKCFAIIRTSELTDELIEKANDSITSILTEYYGNKVITDTVDMISVFCVDRITPAFKKLLNSNLQQGLKNGRLLAGISFGGKNMYISTQKDGFAILKYKRLRKDFVDIMNLQ